MPWISSWEMRNFQSLDAENRVLRMKLKDLEKTQTARVPKGLERLIPSASKYLTTRLFFGPQEWDLAAIERDLKHLDTYEDCNAGEALAKHLQEAEEYTGPGFWTNGRPPSWWDLRAPENSQSVTNNFTPCCDHADTQKEGN